MYYKGGTIHFGKLLMLDAQMQVVDLRPTRFFDFSLDRYKDQLVAGYERTLPDLGLEVYMLGLDKLELADQYGVEAAEPFLCLLPVPLDPLGHQVEHLRFEVHRAALRQATFSRHSAGSVRSVCAGSS